MKKTLSTLLICVALLTAVSVSAAEIDANCLNTEIDKMAQKLGSASDQFDETPRSVVGLVAFEQQVARSMFEDLAKKAAKTRQISACQIDVDSLASWLDLHSRNSMNINDVLDSALSQVIAVKYDLKSLVWKCTK